MYEASNSALSTSEINDGHTDKGKHKCDVCSKMFRRKSNLVQHKTIHMNEKNHQCDVCAKLFRIKSNLVQHKKIHTNEKSHKCVVCFKLFRLKSDLVQHKTIHTNEKNYKCDVCSKLFRLKLTLVQHKKTHTNEKNHKCDVCSKLFRLKFTLMQHKIIHTNEKNHKCDVCSKLFRLKSHLVQHTKIHTNEKNHKCDVCSMPFCRKFTLVRHKKIHTNEKRSYQCFECGKNFTYRDGIIKHLQRHKKCPLKCDKCMKVFISAVQLKTHYKIHIKENLFSCNLCAESFVEKRKLKSHIFIKHIHDSERDLILQPYNNSLSLHEESGMKSCSVVLERFQIENNVVYDVKAIIPSEPMDNDAPIEVKVEPTDSSESKPFNVSIIYNEEDVEDRISLGNEESPPSESKPFNVSIMYNEEDVEDGISVTNDREINSAIDEVKQENCIVKLENYDDVESAWEENLQSIVG